MIEGIDREALDAPNRTIDGVHVIAEAHIHTPTAGNWVSSAVASLSYSDLLHRSWICCSTDVTRSIGTR
jgi:hypothetical protein